MSDYERGRAEVTAAVEAVLADAKPALSTDPLDCTNSCADGPCDCSGVNRVLAWELDKDAIRAALSDPDAALNRVKAEALREAAEAWDDRSERNLARLQRMADEYYHTGGPSMPAIWLRDRADRIARGGDDRG